MHGVRDVWGVCMWLCSRVCTCARQHCHLGTHLGSKPGSFLMEIWIISLPLRLLHDRVHRQEYFYINMCCYIKECTGNGQACFYIKHVLWVPKFMCMRVRSASPPCRLLGRGCDNKRTKCVCLCVYVLFVCSVSLHAYRRGICWRQHFCAEHMNTCRSFLRLTCCSMMRAHMKANLLVLWMYENRKHHVYAYTTPLCARLSFVICTGYNCINVRNIT